MGVLSNRPGRPNVWRALVLALTLLLVSGQVASAVTNDSTYGPGSGPAVASSVTQTISGNGGTVSLPDGTVRINLPQGTVQGSAVVTVAVLPANQVTQPFVDLSPIGILFAEIVAERPDGQDAQLSGKVQVTFTYSQADVDGEGVSESDLLLAYWDPDLQSWITVPTKVDPATNTLTGTIRHLTLFTVVVRKPAVFSDISSHWARGPLQNLVKRGILSGYGDGTLRPDNQVTRNEIARILGVADGRGRSATKFSDDTSIPAWARGFAGAMKDAGLMQGYEDGSFGGDRPMTRFEMAVLAARFLGLQARATSFTGTLPFSDAAGVPEWARGSVGVLNELGVFKGYEDNTFRGSATLTRAEVAALLDRLLAQAGN